MYVQVQFSPSNKSLIISPVTRGVSPPQLLQPSAAPAPCEAPPPARSPRARPQTPDEMRKTWTKPSAPRLSCPARRRKSRTWRATIRTTPVSRVLFTYPLSLWRDNCCCVRCYQRRACVGNEESLFVFHPPG